ncbi:MAG TPA: sodium/glutamate symporter [Burkholderiales bacterium]|nr:sodium/glutamate symporter [Burkholderiales bacterium]
MQSLELNLIHTVLLSMIVLFAGRALVANIGVLQRFSIPAPVVGGGVMAILLALADGLGGIKVSFDMALKDSLLLMFFTTIGLAADARMLAKGGVRLLVFLGISAGLVVAQNVVGIAAALAFDLHPVIGLFGGSITLVGGHGTGAAYAARLGETMNLQGAMELAMAAATAGLVIGAVLGGPVTEYLIKRHKLAGPAGAAPGDSAGAAAAEADEVTSRTLINTLFVVLACLAGGKTLVRLMEGSGIILPDFVFSLLLGVVIRNSLTFTKGLSLSNRTVEVVGEVSLSLFLVMALMTMKLLDLANLAGPLLAILALQSLLMIAFTIFITYNVMGRNYDAAVISGGQIGFGLSSTACALAVMKAVTGRHGASALAFLIVPMVGAFFIDILNAMIIQGSLALPLFGFGP